VDEARGERKWISCFGASYPDAEVSEALHKNEKTQRGWHEYTPRQIEAALELSSSWCAPTASAT
jgi:hypothetical protein